MTQAVLPPVAKSFHTFCKKCDVDRYHIVLTHTSSTSAKIECEVCHSKKTYTVPKEGSMAKKAKVAGAAKVPRARKNSHADEYNSLMLNRGAEKGIPFSIKTKFQMDQKIEHTKFGPGFVKTVQPDRVDVMFSDEVKTLMHNKV